MSEKLEHNEIFLGSIEGVASFKDPQEVYAKIAQELAYMGVTRESFLGFWQKIQNELYPHLDLALTANEWVGAFEALHNEYDPRESQLPSTLYQDKLDEMVKMLLSKGKKPEYVRTVTWEVLEYVLSNTFGFLSPLLDQRGDINEEALNNYMAEMVEKHGNKFVLKGTHE